MVSGIDSVMDEALDIKHCAGSFLITDNCVKT